MRPLGEGWDVARVNRWVAYHDAVASRMTAARTALESALIPVTLYILFSAAEAYRRWPEMMAEIAAVADPAEIGRRGARPGSRVNAVHLWSIANIFLVGRTFLTVMGRLSPDADPERAAVLFDFWERAARAYRCDGHLMCADAGDVNPAYDTETVRRLAECARAVDADTRDAVRACNGALMAYLFHAHFDTRVGTGDTGPYDLGGGRVLLTRDYYQLQGGDLPCADAGAGLPYADLTAAYVLEGVELRVDDWGTSRTDPAEYLEHCVAFGLYDAGTSAPVPLGSLGDVAAAARSANRALYREIAAMTKRDKIVAGAEVYFGFLRPFAKEAGVDDRFDWGLPGAAADILDILEPLEGFGGTSATLRYAPYGDGP